MTVDVDLRGGDWLDDNRANWDERVPVHVASEFYDRAPLRRGGIVLDPIARAGIERMHPEGLEMHPLDEVLGSLRGAGLAIDTFTEHYRVPWQIFPIAVPQGDGMFGWPAQRWLPLSNEVVASTPLR